MIKMASDSEIPMQEFTELFSRNPHVYYNMDRLEELMYRLRAKITSRETQLVMFMYNHLGYRPMVLDRSTIEKYFDSFYVPPEFYTTKNGSFTYTKDTKEQMIAAGILEDFNTLHLNMSSMSTEYSKIVKIIQRSNSRLKVEGNNGKLTKIPYNVVPSRNRRFNSSEENTIGMHRIINPSMEAKKGYLLIQGDFPQIDGRGALNIYFKSGFTEDLIANLEDSYIVYKEISRWFPYLKAKHELAELLKHDTYSDTSKLEQQISRFQSEVLPFSNKAHRDLYKVIALRTVYNSSSSPLMHEDREIKKLSAALNSMPVYAAMRHYALYLRQVGYPVVVKSMFGYERSIIESSEHTFLAQLFNSPIQATSSEIIIYVIMKIMNHFQGLGHGEDKIRLYLNRHDEPIFEIEEDFFIEHYDFFNEVSWVAVPGWKPFKIDWMVSHSYGTPLPEYTDMVTRAKECPDRTIQSVGQFFPLDMPRIMALKTHTLVDDRVVLVLSEFVGAFPEDGFNFGRFKDKRDIVFDAKISKLNGENISQQFLLSIVNTLLERLSPDKPFLVFMEGCNQLTHLTMGDKDVWITGVANDLNVINNCIVASVVNYLNPEFLNEELRYWFSLTDRLQGRMRKRGNQDT